LQHQALVGGPNPSCCPICNKLCMSGELLMEHMKFVHKDPNASGVPGSESSTKMLFFFFEYGIVTHAHTGIKAGAHKDMSSILADQ
jgi:hypothetical protein